MTARQTRRARYRPIIGACLSLLSGCVTGGLSDDRIAGTKAWSVDAQETRNLMIGKWLGESKTRDGELRLSLVERNENGTYRITFRSYRNRSYEESVEVGLWGISGPTYFTIMRGWIIDGTFAQSDPTRAYYYDAYRVTTLNATLFEYESMETGNRFSNRRVGDDFQFSD